MDDIAAESLYASMGLSDTFIDTVATETTYTSGGGTYMVDGINALGYAEQQLFSDAEMFGYLAATTGTALGEVRTRAMVWAPACDNTCSAAIDWDYTWLKANDTNLGNSQSDVEVTWAAGVQNLLNALDLDDFWNSSIYYLNFGGHNGTNTNFKHGIAAALSLLQAAADESPLQSIFTKLTAYSYSDRGSSHDSWFVNWQEHPILVHFALPNSDQLEAWASSKNYAVPDTLDWAVCYDIDSVDYSVESYNDILDQLAELGMIKHYHVAGGGIKPFFVASGEYSQTIWKDLGGGLGEFPIMNSSVPARANGFYFAYDPEQQGRLDLVDTGKFACSWDPDPHELSYDTGWLDHDNPGAAGDGNHDWEKLYMHVSDGSILEYFTRIEPAYVEMRRISDGADVINTGDAFTLRTMYGGKVKNYSDNPASGDYEIRFHYGWTPWLDRDDPSGLGDNEYHHFYTDWSNSNSPWAGRMPERDPEAVECRALANPGTVFDDTMADQDGYIVGDLLGDGTNWTFRCSVEDGYGCLKSDNGNAECPDVEARYFFGISEICDGDIADGTDNGLCDQSNT